jgi:arylsulfatase A-like enzyme
MRRAAAVALLAFAAACERAPAPQAIDARVRSRELHPIVLITLDTTRRDHLGCYGYFRDTTPAIDAFAAESVRFDRAVATAAMTLPSHLSMFTGLYVHQHGVPSNLPRGRAALDAQEPSSWVPSVLSSAGYDTAAFVGALVVGPETGMSQGFDVFDVLQGPRRKGADTADVALRWLGERSERPFFLWIHLFDPHEPNTPEPQYASLFTRSARLDAEIDARGIHPERLSGGAKGELCRMLFPDLLERLAQDPDLELPPIDRARIADLMNRYDADVRYTDDCVKRILDALKERGLFDRAVVAIVGDHGQSLGQNDWLSHGRITNENLLVPMLVHFPREVLPQPAIVSGTTSTIDLFPTIFGAFEHESLRRFVESTEGRDVFAPGFERKHALAQGALDESDTRPGGAVALISDRWRYVDDGNRAARLYDLAADPNAQQDVSASNAELCARFKADLDELLARRAKEIVRPSKTSKEHRQALKNLGYAGDER